MRNFKNVYCFTVWEIELTVYVGLLEAFLFFFFEQSVGQKTIKKASGDNEISKI